MDISLNDQIGILISGLRSQDKEHRAICTNKIVQLGSDAVPFLIQLLQDDDWKVRYRASEALGMIKSDDAVPCLIMTCSDEKDHVRYMAAKSLGLIRTPDAVPVLISLLEDDHPYTRGISSESLAAIQDPRGTQPLETAFEREIDPVVRGRISQSLMQMGRKG